MYFIYFFIVSNVFIFYCTQCFYHLLYPMFSRVVPFVKIGSGYNSHEWSVMNQHLEPILIPTKTANSDQLSSISDLKGADRPDLLVTDPHRSVVIQIKGSQILATGTYKTLGLTLRFPRFIKLRLDRAADSSLKISGNYKLCNSLYIFVCRAFEIAGSYCGHLGE